MAERLVGKYYLYQATRSIGFISPIFALFVLRDLSFTHTLLHVQNQITRRNDRA
jgi:hypothetical protein